MAEEKTSFLLYTDLIHTVKKLPNDAAGKLFKIILEYVNDTDPVVDDLLLELVFEPIKQNLKRDLKKWEAKRSKKSDSGKIGGLKSGESRRKKALLKNSKQNEANEAVSVSDNVSVSVSDNPIKKSAKKSVPKKKKKVQEPVSPLLIQWAFETDEFKNTYMLWLQHLRDKGKEATEATIIAQMQFLKRWNQEIAIGIIQKSLNGGWTELYEPKVKNETDKFNNQTGDEQSTGTSAQRVQTARGW
jgi:hypothetical protein